MVGISKLSIFGSVFFLTSTLIAIYSYYNLKKVPKGPSVNRVDMFFEVMKNKKISEKRSKFFTTEPTKPKLKINHDPIAQLHFQLGLTDPTLENEENYSSSFISLPEFEETTRDELDVPPSRQKLLEILGNFNKGKVSKVPPLKSPPNKKQKQIQESNIELANEPSSDNDAAVDDSPPQQPHSPTNDQLNKIEEEEEEEEEDSEEIAEKKIEEEEDTSPNMKLETKKNDLKELSKPIKNQLRPIDPKGKYVVFDLTVGKVNNAIWALMRALELSKKMERTLLVPRNDCASFDLFEIINKIDDYYDVVFVDEVHLESLNNGNPVRFFYRYTNEIPDPVFCMPLKNQDVIGLAKRSDSEDVIERVKSKTNDDDTVIVVSNPFFWNSFIPAREIWQYIDFPPHIKSTAEKFLKTLPTKTWQNNNFIAVHIRNFEGRCQNKARIFGAKKNKFYPLSRAAATDLALKFCDMDSEMVKKVLAFYRFDVTSRGYFLASDNQRLDLVRDHEKKGAITLDKFAEKKKLNEIEKTLVEMYVAIQSQFFIGNPFSLMSTIIKDYRLSRGGVKEGNWMGVEHPTLEL